VRVLILGNGAREHALAWKFSQSALIAGLYVAPGNAGTAERATNLPEVNPLKSKDVIDACRTYKIDLVFVGPEDPLSAGIVDALAAEKIAAIGPHREAAQLESSKAFSKKFMIRNGVPTAEYREFASFDEFEKYHKKNKKRIVLKKSGLAAGKGVLESEDREEQLAFAESVLSNDVLVAEEFLEGFETSIFAICDGKDYVLLPACMDYKKAGEGNTGPNTGGMGSICPLPILDGKALERIRTEIVDPTFEGLRKENLLYRGVLYFGLMATSAGPKVLEYNVRFGDPETQTLLPLVTSDFGNLWDAVNAGKLASFPLGVSDKAALGVVVASPGYPGKYSKKLTVEIKDRPDDRNLLVFHAATIRNEEGRLLTNGGRCFTVVGIGKDLFEAASKAYGGVGCVRFRGAWYRKDIGKGIIED